MNLPVLPERDSPRDQLVVTLFLLTVFGLLLGAGIKNRMVKAGFDTSVPWNASRRWWEVRISFAFRLLLLLRCLFSRLGHLNGKRIIWASETAYSAGQRLSAIEKTIMALLTLLHHDKLHSMMSSSLISV